jgi:uncharacterized protein YyaL (SSP411 family)
MINPMAETGKRVRGLAEALRGKGAVDGRATFYLCANRSCLPPTTDPKEVEGLLKKQNA